MEKITILFLIGEDLLVTKFDSALFMIIDAISDE